MTFVIVFVCAIRHQSLLVRCVLERAEAQLGLVPYVKTVLSVGRVMPGVRKLHSRPGSSDVAVRFFVRSGLSLVAVGAQGMVNMYPSGRAFVSRSRLAAAPDISRTEAGVATRDYGRARPTFSSERSSLLLSP